MVTAKDDYDNHITWEDMQKVFSIDENHISDEDLTLIAHLKEKVKTCEVCKKRYYYAIKSQKMLTSLSPQNHGLLADESIVSLLKQKISSLDLKIQEQIEKWLEGTQILLQSLEAASFRPALATATRGIEDKDSQSNIKIISQESGSFEFSLETNSEIIFEINRSLKDGVPFCLIIQGVDNNQYFQVLPLNAISLPGIASPKVFTPKVKLEKGKYSFSIPLLEA